MTEAFYRQAITDLLLDYEQHKDCLRFHREVRRVMEAWWKEGRR